MRSRLYLQIYATVFACLLAVVVAFFMSFVMFTEDGPPKRWQKLASTLIERLLPDPQSPLDVQNQQLKDLSEEIDMDMAVYTKDGTLIIAHGRTLKIPRHELLDNEDDRFDRWRGKFIYHTSDGRIAVARPRFQAPDNGLWKLIGTLILIIIAVLLAAYPLIRRLTRRLETFHATVEKAREGDLSARVEINGKDEIAQLANAYNASAERIERLVQSNKMLLANASHELRTPLSRIRLGVEMVKDGGAPQRLDALQADIAELDELIDEILLMSRLEESSDRMTFEPVDLLALAAEECSRFEDCRLTGQHVEINADVRLLRRLLRNLITNAHRHGKPPVEVTLSNSGKMAQLTVSDHGEGIPENARAHIFEPFFRGQGKQNVAGYGLGLALVKQIAQSHDGSVTLGESDHGGACFIVEFPLT